MLRAFANYVVLNNRSDSQGLQSKIAQAQSVRAYPKRRIEILCFNPQCTSSARRLDDRIRALCAKAGTATPSEVEKVLQELKAALAEHTRRLRELAAQKLIGDGDSPQRRSILK